MRTIYYVSDGAGFKRFRAEHAFDDSEIVWAPNMKHLRGLRIGNDKAVIVGSMAHLSAIEKRELLDWLEVLKAMTT